jgi:hypothetical protein
MPLTPETQAKLDAKYSDHLVTMPAKDFATMIADGVAAQCNAFAGRAMGWPEMPYKSQWLLEEVIRQLKERV